MGGDIIAERILASNDPVKPKRLGSNAKGNIAVWIDVAKQVVYRAVKAKFKHHYSLQGSKHRSRLGIGLFLGTPHCTNKATWKGSNCLGEIPMKVRSELS